MHKFYTKKRMFLYTLKNMTELNTLSTYLKFSEIIPKPYKKKGMPSLPVDVSNIGMYISKHYAMCII